MAERDLDHSTEKLRNALRANQKGGYTLLMKAVAEAIIELARDSRYVGGTATEKSITPRPHSIQRSFRIDCATQKLLVRYQKEVKVNRGSIFPATNKLRSSIYFLRDGCS